MSGETQVYHSHAKKYWLVFILLTVLTAAELVAADGGLAYSVKAFSLTFLAIAKAISVAYWYMHLDEEKGWLKFIAAIPISAAIYAIVLMLETVAR